MPVIIVQYVCDMEEYIVSILVMFNTPLDQSWIDIYSNNVNFPSTGT